MQFFFYNKLKRVYLRHLGLRVSRGIVIFFSIENASGLDVLFKGTVFVVVSAILRESAIVFASPRKQFPFVIRF